MLSSKKFQVLLFLFSFLHLNVSDRLTLLEGGYARVLGPQQIPIGSFTVSAWVNVTKFPDGVAPVLTYFNNDINSQLAFFLREDGVGVLWGGPTVREEDNAFLARRPRLLWSEMKNSHKSDNRRKREAIDYSGGLGDIENILYKRIGKANAWAPMNFVDVGDMGVDDLMVSGSDHYTDGIDRSSRAHAYSDWTNVPYELHMAESEVDKDYEDTKSVADSPIITQPSGDADDFVYFNWNNPTAGQRQVPLGSNSWSPVWEPTKKSAEPDIQNDLYANEYKGPTAQASALAEPTEVLRPPSAITKTQSIDMSNSWNPVDNNYETIPPRPLQTKLLPNKHERPIWPSRSNLPPKTLPVRVVSSQAEPPIAQEKNVRYQPVITSPTIPSRELPNSFTRITSDPPTTQSSSTTTPIAITTTSQPIISTTPTFETEEKSTPPQKSSLLPRRNIIPTLYRYTVDRKQRPTTITTPKMESITKPSQPSKSRTRVPLWKLIKKPTKSDPQIQKKTEEFIEASASENKKQIYNFPLYEKPKQFDSAERVTPASNINKHQFLEPTLPPIRAPNSLENLQTTASNTRNIYRSRPVHSPARRTLTTTVASTTTPTTELPKTTAARKIPYVPTQITHKTPNYHSSKIEEQNLDIKLTSLHNKNYKEVENKFSHVDNKSPPRHQSHANEFEKAMQDPELIRVGNRAVVYAVPITNEKEFYDMYKKYQDQSIKTIDDKPNLHDLYNDMRTGNTDSSTLIQDSKQNKIKETSYLHNSEKLTPISNVIAPAKVENDKISKISHSIQDNSEIPYKSDIAFTTNAPRPEAELETKYAEIEGPDSETYYVYEDEVPANEEQYYEYDGNEENLQSPDLLATQNVLKPEIINEDVNVPKHENTDPLSDLYRPEVVATTNVAEKIPPSHFQEPAKLYHEQLPPQYEKPEKQYDFNAQNNGIFQANLNEEVTSDDQERFHNEEIISQESIPIPVHNFDEEETSKFAATNANSPIPIHPQQLPSNPFKQVEPQSSPNIFGHTPSTIESQPQYAVPSHAMGQPSYPVISPNQFNAEFDTHLSDVDFDPTEETNLDIHFEKVPYTFRENGWYHLAYTWNAHTKILKIYVNGEKVADISNVMADKSHMEEGGIFLLGKTLLPDLSDFDTSSQFEGEMSDVNLWTTELDLPAIDSLFQCQYTPTSHQSLNWQTTQMNLYDDAFMVPSPPFCGLVT